MENDLRSLEKKSIGKEFQIAAIVNATLIDYGLTTKTNKTALVDHKRMERTRKSIRDVSIFEQEVGVNAIEAVYVDGKIDRTIVSEKKSVTESLFSKKFKNNDFIKKNSERRTLCCSPATRKQLSYSFRSHNIKIRRCSESSMGCS